VVLDHLINVTLCQIIYLYTLPGLVFTLRVTSLHLIKIPLSRPGNPYWRGKLGTVDLLVQPNLDQLLLILKTFFVLFTKQATLTRKSTVLTLPLQLVFPALPVSLDCFPLKSLFVSRQNGKLTKWLYLFILPSFYFILAFIKKKPLRFLHVFKLYSKYNTKPRNTNWRGRPSTVNLLLKVAHAVKKLKNVCNIKNSRSKLVSTRRSTILSLPFQ
jgi:hypothetical protein